MTGKNPRWGLVGDLIPVGDGDGGNLFPTMGMGWGYEWVQGWGICSLP